mgnify:CR=1 FL=1
MANGRPAVEHSLEPTPGLIAGAVRRSVVGNDDCRHLVFRQAAFDDFTDQFGKIGRTQNGTLSGQLVGDACLPRLSPEISQQRGGIENL